MQGSMPVNTCFHFNQCKGLSVLEFARVRSKSRIYFGPHSHSLPRYVITIWEVDARAGVFELRR